MPSLIFDEFKCHHLDIIEVDISFLSTVNCNKKKRRNTMNHEWLLEEKARK